MISLLLAAVMLAAFDNLELGIPGPADQIVERRGYALGYSEKYEQPLWVSYRLTADEVTNTAVARAGQRFLLDLAIMTGSALPGDYTRSGFDRGHLAPAADFRFDLQTMLESFSRMHRRNGAVFRDVSKGTRGRSPSPKGAQAGAQT